MSISSLRISEAGLALASLILCALASELLLREVRGEVNHLSPVLVPHPVLMQVIERGSAGHDLWGFRNPEVPERADVVAVGDSQTYGVSAVADESWPAWLQQLSGRSVYNLALGGYGPREYRYLVSEYALRLQPKLVLVGFYFGNDLRSLWRPGQHPKPEDSRARRDDPRPLGELRTWLASNSMLYQTLKRALPGLAERIRSRELQLTRPADTLEIADPEVGTLLTPELRFAVLDPQQESNRAGLREAEQMLLEIRDLCRASRVQLGVLLLPTKESVYAELARSRSSGPELARIEALVQAEREVKQQLQQVLARNEVAALDLLPSLSVALRERRLYLPKRDGHPTGAGYRVIAAATHAWLDPQSLEPRAAEPRPAAPGPAPAGVASSSAIGRRSPVVASYAPGRVGQSHIPRSH